MAPDQPQDGSHHPVINEQAGPFAVSLGGQPPRATINQPCGRKQQVNGLATGPPPAPTRVPRPPGSPTRPTRLSLTALDVEGAGVIQPVQLVLAARLGLPGVGEAGPRGLHQPTGRLKVIPFQAVEIPAEA